MRIAITDANIFIDLFLLEISQHLFEIGCEIYTTGRVLRELENHHRDYLRAHIQNGQIKVENITNEEAEEFKKNKHYVRLSDSDISVLILAEKLDAFVLSGDDLVRKTCKVKNLEYHGILWCLDQFVIKKCITKNAAVKLLNQLMKINIWLPKEICKEYIENKWGGEF